MQRFFDRDDLHVKYEERLGAIEWSLKDRYEEYDDALHGPLIRSLARSEVMCERYEEEIANNRDGPNHRGLLRDERNHMYRLWTELESSLGAMLRAKRESEQDHSTNITVINQQVHNIVTVLRNFAQKLPEEHKQELYKELETVKVGVN